MLFALMANANSQSLNKKQDKRKSLRHNVTLKFRPIPFFS